MTRILVTGGTGFIGRALCDALLVAGHKVTATCRRDGIRIDGVDIQPIDDIGPDTAWSDALQGVDAVVHLAAHVHARHGNPRTFQRVNVEGTDCLVRAARDAGVERFVYMSTVKAMGETGGHEAWSEDHAATPGDAYGTSKLAGEEAVRRMQDSEFNTVILRPPLVYGPRVGGNFLAFMRLCASGVPVPLGGIDNRRSLIFVGNLVDAVTTCLRDPRAAGATFLVRDGDDVSTPELFRRTAAAMGATPRLFSLPPGLLHLGAALTGRRRTLVPLTADLAVDDGAIRRRLDWQPPFTMEQGLAETARWYRRRASTP